MDRPVILLVDDDVASLAIVDREVRKRYGADYRVVAKQSTQDALDELQRLHDAGEPVALVLADQWMPGMPGAEFLGRARVAAPLAKRVMLVSWGDSSGRQAILDGCAFGQIEYFVTKPWHASPDERFHHQVGEFLYEWSRGNRPAFEAVKVVGERWSRRSTELRDLLGRNGIPYGFYDVDGAGGQGVLRENGMPNPHALPVVVVFGGTVLTDPSNREISEALGAREGAREGAYDLVVIGAGPAGLAAAVYGAPEGLRTAVIEREALGGQAGQSTLIHNYLGFPAGISGDVLAARAYEQAWQFGATFFLSDEVVGLEEEDGAHLVRLDDGSELRARTVIIATGISYRRLGTPRLEELQGAGVFYGSVSSEARSLVDFDVYVVGAANSAGQAALHLAEHARQVTVLSRRASIEETMSSYLIKQLEGAENVDVLTRTRVVDGGGDGRLGRLTLQDVDTEELRTVPAEALFVMIGATPHTDWLPEGIARDEAGYILTGSDLLTQGNGELWSAERAPYGLETSMRGVFAVGDVRHGSVKRVASAAGEGAMAVRYCHECLERFRMKQAA
jgi:thioredoxin reductase (NADPH)